MRNRGFPWLILGITVDQEGVSVHSCLPLLFLNCDEAEHFGRRAWLRENDPWLTDEKITE